MGSSTSILGSDHSMVCRILLGVFSWSFLYIVAKNALFRKHSSEYSSRVVAAMHALIVTPLAYMCYQEGPNPFLDGAGEPNTELQTLALEISLSYFIYDIFWCIYYGSEPFIMIVHHVCSISSIFLVLVKGVSGAEAVIGLGTMEASNPYLQLRWFLRTYGFNNTRLHMAVEFYFFALFMVMRLGFGTALTYCIVQSTNVTVDVKICTGLLYIISLGFIFYMYLYIRKKYFRRSDQNSLVADESKKDT